MAPPPSESLDSADRHFGDLKRAFVDRFGQETSGGTGPLVLARAPGRVNLIGGHTDYNDGFVLPATIDRAVYVVEENLEVTTLRTRLR